MSLSPLPVSKHAKCKIYKSHQKCKLKSTKALSLSRNSRLYCETVSICVPCQSCVLALIAPSCGHEQDVLTCTPSFESSVTIATILSVSLTLQEPTFLILTGELAITPTTASVMAASGMSLQSKSPPFRLYLAGPIEASYQKLPQECFYGVTE